MEHRLGIDIGGTKIAIGLVDDEGIIIHQGKYATNEFLTSRQESVAGLGELIRNFCKQNGSTLSKIGSVGIGVPGIIDYAAQTITSCPNLCALDDLALGPCLTEELGIPVWVENDVNLIALGEYSRGRGQGLKDVAYIFVGTGIGCGLILNHELYTGADGSAGEFGHMSIVPDGLPCGCGNTGCLEMYCSGKALSIMAAQGAGEKGHRWSTAADLIHAAHSGESVALELMEQSFRYLGYGIANLVNLLNPRMVVLGGGIITGWPAGLQTVENVLAQSVREIFRRNLRVEYPLLGEQAGLIGAAVYAKSNRSHHSALES